MSEQLPDPTFIPGLELRDWFAGMALQGLLANNKHLNPVEIAIESYEIAQRMLEVRNDS